jgi:hypothetical protein
MPLAGLFADTEAGCGSLRFDATFEECDAINQLRIVEDWQRDLSAARDRMFTGLFRSRFATLPVPRDEQVARFTRYCTRLGLQCPAALVVGLVAPVLPTLQRGRAPHVPQEANFVFGKDTGPDEAW